jgi:hypothetical protein
MALHPDMEDRDVDGGAVRAPEPEAPSPAGQGRGTQHGASTLPDAAAAILEALIARASTGCIWATELAFTGGARRADFWKMEVGASKGFQATAYEIKISRADFRRDTPVKQREARLYSDRFYYVAPLGLIKPDEVPEWAGLMEFGPKGLVTTVPAPMRSKDAPSWELVVSLFRNSGEIRRDTDVMRSSLYFAQARCKQLEAQIDQMNQAAMRRMMADLAREKTSEQR